MHQIFYQESSLSSDIARYFEIDVITDPISAGKGANWLFK